MQKTIVALATPPGISGLAVIRISGVESINILQKIFYTKSIIDYSKGGRIYYGKIIFENELIDTVTVSIFISPKSYTGENTIEIGCHGNVILANKIIDIIIRCGAYLAEPGEFTKRSFLNGKIDLSQAEAIADMIHSVSTAGVSTAAKQLEGKFTIRLSMMRQKLLDISSLLELELDFADEGLDLISKEKISKDVFEASEFCTELINSFTASEICRSGYYVGIAGYPNSGKSTLFNTLLDRSRAIVSEIAGTTRDYLEESIYINGLKIIIADTAGIRETIDTIEIEGIKLVDSVLEKSNLVMVLNDTTVSSSNSDKLAYEILKKYPGKDIEILQNKIDLSNYDNSGTINLSAKSGEGVPFVRQLIYDKAVNSIAGLSDIMINSRHRQLLENANISLNSALDSIGSDKENEIIAIDIRNATRILGELTGEYWNEEVLANIFSRFCIGK